MADIVASAVVSVAQSITKGKSSKDIRHEGMKKLEDAYAEPPPYSSQLPSNGVLNSNEGSGGRTFSNVPAIEELDFTPSTLEIPTPAECIAHLKLLHAFAKLREDVENCEGLFGIHAENLGDDVRGDTRTDELRGRVHAENPAEAATEAHAEEPNSSSNTPTAALAERIRNKRWEIFVHKAVQRFEKWLDMLSRLYPASSVYDTPITQLNFDGSNCFTTISQFPIDGEGLDQFEKFALPPLDVLMVWHAYMLNPRTYLEDCIRYSRHMLWRTVFPWRLVYVFIDDKTFEYNPPNTTTFEEKTKCPWDLLQDQELKHITCPQCSTPTTVPWTMPPSTSTLEAVESYLQNDFGFSGKSFEHDCSTCDLAITHEKLRVGKFIEDARQVLEHTRPLPGTVLSILGAPEPTINGKTLGSHDPFFPNRVVERLERFQPPQLRQNVKNLAVDGLRGMFQEVVKSKKEVSFVNVNQVTPELLARNSRIVVRKVLSHYWDNSSPFGLDLCGAVLRQGTFVQKMHQFDWLHSPNLMSTTQRLIVKYHRFVRLAADAGIGSVVPTLDVDLAWHTHLLTPHIYYVYTLSETHKLLNHDDRIPESNLHKNFQLTARAYEKRYAQPYAECACWYCECTREPLRSGFLSGKLGGTLGALAKKVDVLGKGTGGEGDAVSLEAIAKKGFPTNAWDGVHLSSHNAWNPEISETNQTAQQRRQDLEELDLQYAKVCKRYAKAQKQKKSNNTKNPQPPPPRNNSTELSNPALSLPPVLPFSADPSTTPQHTHDALGACVARTCGGTVSLGSCAAPGMPACQSSCGGKSGYGAGGGCGGCGA